MTREELYAYCLEQEQAPFHGWDFSPLASGDRMQTDPLPWDYRSVILQYLTVHKTALLDMGTGGGQLLSTLPRLPFHAHATESYPPNIEAARRRLGSKGVVIHPQEEDAPLPFKDRYFDILLNRHGLYDPAELFRVTRPGGHFITQQVRGDDSLELNRRLEIRHPGEGLDWNLEKAAQALTCAGFAIVRAEEAQPEQRFLDVGAVVYFAKQLPWQFPGFSVERDFNALYDLHRYFQTHGVLVTHAPRFLIVAMRPAT